MQTPVAGHIEAEFRVLSDLANTLISGKYIEIEDTLEYQDGDTKVTVMPVYQKSVEYLFTIEETTNSMKITLRSTRLPELFIALPSPLVVRFGGPEVLEELC